MTEVVDAEVVGTDLEVMAPAPASLFHTDDPVEVLDKASAVASALASVIDRQNMFTTIKGKKYVEIAGWQTLGSMLGVTAVVVSTNELAPGDWEARAEARTVDGRVVGAADAMCCAAEGGNWTDVEQTNKWGKIVPPATSNARRAMAQTRAMSRALRGPLGFVVNLAGYQATAAEEMPNDPVTLPAAPLTDAAVAEVSATISAALAAGVTGDELRAMWHATGSRPAQINLDAVATLTEPQAAKLTKALQERLP